MRKIIFLMLFLILIVSSADASFNSTWNTSKSGVSNSSQITLPLYNGGTYNFVAHWGDGSSSIITAYNSPNVTHTYSSPGIYNVSIDGTIIGFRFNNGGDKLKIIDISNWGQLRLGNLNGYFYGCSNMEVTATDVLDLTGTTNMYSMFRGCSVANPDVSGFDTSEVTTMASMFSGCVNANPDVSGFDTSKVTDMGAMFYGCANANPDVSGFDISKVTTMASIFYGCTNANPDVSGFDTSKVTTMASMFDGCTNANPDVSGFDTSNVTTMTYMFSGCTNANPDVSGFDTSKVTTMAYMFRGCTNANPDVSSFDTSKVTDMLAMFRGCTNANPDVSGFDTSKVTSMNSMFYDCANANPDVSGFNTSQVTTMAYMFYGCTAWSTDNFNKALLAWGNQSTVVSGVSFNSYSRKYYSGLPTTRRQALIDKGWSFTDGGQTYGTGYFGVAMSLDGGTTWMPVNNSIIVLSNVSIDNILFRSTTGADLGVTVANASITDDITEITDSHTALLQTVNITHTASANMTSGTIIPYEILDGYDGTAVLSSNNTNASISRNETAFVISTGYLAAGSTYYYLVEIPNPVEEMLWSDWDPTNETCNAKLQIGNSTPYTTWNITTYNVTNGSLYKLVYASNGTEVGNATAANGSASIIILGLVDGVYWLTETPVLTGFVNVPAVAVTVVIVAGGAIGASFIGQWYRKRRK